jgi:hypothetical protein
LDLGGPREHFAGTTASRRRQAILATLCLSVFLIVVDSMIRRCLL